MRKWISLVAVSLLVAVSAFGVQGNGQGEPTGLTVRAGVFFPSERAVRDATNDIWLTAGVEYKIGNLGVPDMQNGYSASYSISADYYGQDDFRAVPVLVNYVGQAQQFHYSVGAGITFAKSATVDNKSSFGYRLALGYDFNQTKMPFFIEVGYFGVTGSDFDTDLNGFFAVAGLRF